MAHAIINADHILKRRMFLSGSTIDPIMDLCIYRFSEFINKVQNKERLVEKLLVDTIKESINDLNGWEQTNFVINKINEYKKFIKLTKYKYNLSLRKLHKALHIVSDQKIEDKFIEMNIDRRKHVIFNEIFAMLGHYLSNIGNYFIFINGSRFNVTVAFAIKCCSHINHILHDYGLYKKMLKNLKQLLIKSQMSDKSIYQLMGKYPLINQEKK